MKDREDAVEPLRRRLYQPESSADDVRRYTAVAGTPPAVRRRRPAARPARARVVGAVLIGAVLVAAGLALSEHPFATPRPGPTDDVRAQVRAAVVPLTGRRIDAAVQLLVDAGDAPLTEVQVAEVLHALRAAEPLGAGAAVPLGGGGFGSRRLELAPLGAVAAERSVRVTVLSRVRGWSFAVLGVAGNATSAPGFVSPAAATRAAATTVDLRADARDSTLLFRMPPRTPFVYLVDVLD